MMKMHTFLRGLLLSNISNQNVVSLPLQTVCHLKHKV